MNVPGGWQHQPVLLALIAMIVLVLLVLALAVRAARRPGRVAASTAPAEHRSTQLRTDVLRRSFRQATRLIEANITSRAQRYQLPWVLVLDEGSAADGTDHALLLARSGLATALSPAAADAVAAPGLDWHFFDKGVVVNVQGRYLGSAEDDADADKPWDALLALCQRYRPERPIDALVVTVPAVLLMQTSPQAQLALESLARRTNRRIWLAQNRYAMRLGVYVVVSGCESIPGFSAFARLLGERARGSMLGWSTPYEANARYAPGWVDEAMAHACHTLVDAAAEHQTLSQNDEAALGSILLPMHLQATKPQLQRVVDELMRPSSYHEPFLLRGIYFSGDASELAELLAGEAARGAFGEIVGGAGAGAGLNADSDSDSGAGAGTGAWARAGAGVGAGAGAGANAGAAPGRHAHLPHDTAVEPAFDPIPPDSRRPAFLRDLFEQKIFAEVGLSRPSDTQHLSRPLVDRGLRFGAWAVAGGWALGLVAGGLVLHAQADVLQSVLARVHQDAEAELRALQRGAPPPADWQRERTLRLLQLMEQIDGKRLWSVFMPGSWPVFEPLTLRVRTRLEEAFGEVAVSTLRRGLYDQAGHLTGVPQDGSTGELIAGAACRDPATPSPGAAEGADDSTGGPATLGFEDLPAFARLQRFLTGAEQVDQATLALQRLLDPASPAVGADLSLAVRTVLGTDLPGTPQHAAALFRSRAARSQGLATQSLQLALQCSLQRHVVALQDRAFDANDLLLAQTGIDEQLDTLFDAEGDTAGDADPQAWRDLAKRLQALDALLVRGGGAWMQAPALQPGPAWDRSLARIKAVQLLGPASARVAQDGTERRFTRFATTLKESTSEDAAGSVMWDAQTRRWKLSPDTLSLRDALQALLALPWMRPSEERPLPASPDGGPVGWSLAHLDQALEMAGQRQRFRNELLVKFPVDLRAPVERLANQQLSHQVSHHLADAMVPGARIAAADPAVAEEERSRLGRVMVLLGELGARDVAHALRARLQNDAHARLRGLDEALERAELYAPRDPFFGAWQGSKSPMLAAYGLADTAALAGYLGQQRQRIETLGRDAEGLIAASGARSAAGYTPGTARTDGWIALSRDLERYRLKNPNSSLLALENFMVAMAGDIDAGNCAEKLAPPGVSLRAADLFAQRQQQLASALLRRCHELRASDQRGAWRAFSAYFNSQVAGRPPFSTAGWAADAPALETDELRGLLNALDTAQRGLKNIGDDAGQPGPQSVRRFMDQLERTRAFLTPLVPADDSTPAGYDLGVEFRANAQGEAEGNKLIDWQIDVGGQQLGWRDPPRPLRWTPGQAITLTLRLAKDGPAVPRRNERVPALLVDDRTVTLRYDDPWALLNLLQQHRDASGGTAARDARSQLLRVEFPLTLLPELPGGKAIDTHARVYLRLTLSPAGKRTPLAWAGLLPSRAPEVSLP